MRKLILLVLCCFALLQVEAQSIKLLEASSQSWSGGVCCRSGVNYVIRLECLDQKQNITIDTVWIGNKAFFKLHPYEFSVEKSLVKGKTIYKVTFGESHDEHKPDGPYSTTGKLSKNPPYKGKNVVVYHDGKKKGVLVIDKINVLSPLAYP